MPGVSFAFISGKDTVVGGELKESVWIAGILCSLPELPRSYSMSGRSPTSVSLVFKLDREVKS